MNENQNISGISGTLYLKRNDESLYITIFVSLKSKAEIKSQENLAVLKRAMSKNVREVWTS